MNLFPKFDPAPGDDDEGVRARHQTRGAEAKSDPAVDDDLGLPGENFSTLSHFSRGAAARVKNGIGENGSLQGDVETPSRGCSINNNNNSTSFVPLFIYTHARLGAKNTMCAPTPAKPANRAKAAEGAAAATKPSLDHPASTDHGPPEWLAGVARLVKLPCPPGVTPSRWQTTQTDATLFTRRWGIQAARLGWTAYDVFGANRVKPFDRLDGAGLVRLLNGRPVVALTEEEAIIECANGARQTFRNNRPGMLPEGERCLLWDLGAPFDGEGAQRRPLQPGKRRALPARLFSTSRAALYRLRP